MAEPNNKPTMEDVAREAGVALSTVSKVVNNQRVGEGYRLKVNKAIESLGYRYNNSGRALRTSKSSTIAMIVPSMHPFFAKLVYHVNAALSRRNYTMMLFITQDNYDRETECMQLAVENQVDGIIALTYNPTLEIPKNTSIVTIDRFFSQEIPCVASDNFEGSRMAVHKLHELGCRKLALLYSCSQLRTEVSKRKDGFISACHELGIPFETKEIVEAHARRINLFDDFLAGHVHDGKLDYDGLFCCSDLIAWYACNKLREMGIRIPEDVQIIGYDGIRAFGEGDYLVSTIVQPVQEMAETCVSTILSEDFSSRPSLICLPVEFADGGTTKKMP